MNITDVCSSVVCVGVWSRGWAWGLPELAEVSRTGVVLKRPLFPLLPSPPPTTCNCQKGVSPQFAGWNLVGRAGPGSHIKGFPSPSPSPLPATASSCSTGLPGQLFAALGTVSRGKRSLFVSQTQPGTLDPSQQAVSGEKRFHGGGGAPFSHTPSPPEPPDKGSW